jgi:HPt (histidine-containing phosphotransfer) domain-containing protein
MTAGGDDFFEVLRSEYLGEAPARLAELRADLAALAAGVPDAAKSLKARLHRLAGSGGSYGFPDVSVRSREAERCLADHPDPDAAGLARLAEAIDAIAAAFDAAARGAGPLRDQ